MSIISVSGKMGSGKDTVGKIIQYLTAENTEGGKAVGMHCTIEEFLKENDNSCNDVFTIKKWAYKVKQVASIVSGIPIEKFEDQDFKKSYLSDEWNIKEPNFELGKLVDGSQIMKDYKMTVRDLLQKVGTDAMRNGLHKDVWVNAMMNEYKKHSNWIITDTRFPNELNTVKKYGGITIKVTRQRYPDGLYKVAEGTYTGARGYEQFEDALRKEVGIVEHVSETALDDVTFDYEIKNDGDIEQLIKAVKLILETENII